MAFSWGSALTQFGKDLPTVGAGIDNIFDERYKRKRQSGIDERQAILDDLTRQESQLELDKMAEEKTRRGEVGKTMESFTGMIKPYDEPISTSVGMGTVTKPGKPLDEAVSQTGILKFAGDPDAKAALDFINSKEKNANLASKGQEKTDFISTPYEDGSPEYSFAKKMVDGSLPFDSAMQLFTAMGGSSSARPRLLATAYGIKPEYSVLGSLANKAGHISATTGEAGTRARLETARNVQREQPVFSEPQSNAISDSYSAVKYLNKLKNAVSKGDVGYFDIDRKTGQFVNPEAADAYMQMVEIVGRKRSGAAIADSEWKSFGKQILNKNNLLTDAGKQQAIKSLDHYIDKFYGAGANVAGDENWFKNYSGRASTARKSGESAQEQTKVINGKTYKKVDGGWQLQK